MRLMTDTTYLHLKKPDSTDFVNVSDFNDNSDILDENIHSIVYEISVARDTYANLNARLTAIELAISALDDRVTALENNS